MDTNKIFININYAPDEKTLKATNFYINKLTSAIELLKQKCYEMK